MALPGCKDTRPPSGEKSPAAEKAGIAIDPELEASDESPAGKRERAAAILFGPNATRDVPAALALVEEAAREGDPVAAVWYGRTLLEDSSQRTTAAAWFLLALKSDDAAARREAEGEIEALGLSAAEIQEVQKQASALEKALISK